MSTTRMYAISVPALAAVLFAAGPALAGHAVQVIMPVESFDGCGCLEPFNDPVSCAECPVGVTQNHPDCDVYGPGALDLDWKNTGWPAKMRGDNVEPAQGYAAQSFIIGDWQNNMGNTLACGTFAAGAVIWIEYDHKASPNCAATGATRFDFEAVRTALGLPEPIADQPGYLLMSVRRDDVQGSGDTSDITTKIKIIPSGIYPAGATGTGVTVDVPAGEGWKDVVVTELPQYVTKAKFNLMVDLGPVGASVDCSKGERVTIRVDDLRYVYTGSVPDEETDCGNGIDDDQDGLTDCEDLDCNHSPSCACNLLLAFDTDFDGDVDQVDFGFFQRCIAMDVVKFDLLPAECKCLDRTGPLGEVDHIVDQFDLVSLINCASGPGIPADAQCVD